MLVPPGAYSTVHIFRCEGPRCVFRLTLTLFACVAFVHPFAFQDHGGLPRPIEHYATPPVADHPYQSEHLHLDFGVFEALHARPQVEGVVRAYGWRRLLCLVVPTYQDLVWEFYASFSHSQKRSADHADAVHFTLGGVAHSISYWELTTALRLNSPHPSDRPLIVEVTDPTTFGNQAYFQRICLSDYAVEQYIASQTWATLLRPEWWILNHLLTQSYTPSRGSVNRVTLRTLYFMHAIVRLEDTIELGLVITRTFTKACASQDRHLVCGPVITALALYFGVDTIGMTMVRAATPFSEATL
ncbi:unnamed protein product [Linum trigynum]|uniref:Uncharacterized protein n=1 Tax=Linum trigynum TaxID=586398 RepID=A0AAV2D743_9ROSI